MFVAFVEENIPNGMVECEYECGNYTHPSIRVCGDCLDDDQAFSFKNQRALAETRRFFNTYGG